MKQEIIVIDSFNQYHRRYARQHPTPHKAKTGMMPNDYRGHLFLA